MPRPWRIGSVPYLNVVPLTAGLAGRPERARLEAAPPSTLADAVEAGRLDVALVPVWDLITRRGLMPVGNAGIVCRGPALSVRLFLRKTFADLRTIVLDPESHSSNALCRIVVGRRLLRKCAYVLPPPGLSPAEAPGEGFVLIGDRGLLGVPGLFSIDLGTSWHLLTGLPFVFARWAVRADFAEAAALARDLDESRDEGLGRVGELALAEGPRRGIAPPLAENYLREALFYTIGKDEEAGIARFADEARTAGLLPSRAAPWRQPT